MYELGNRRCWKAVHGAGKRYLMNASKAQRIKAAHGCDLEVDFFSGGGSGCPRTFFASVFYSTPPTISEKCYLLTVNNPSGAPLRPHLAVLGLIAKSSIVRGAGIGV
jgi:hypothetical protein